MNNIHRINDFLKLIAIASKNGYNIDKSVVYNNLVYLGISNDVIDISSNFDKWINRFSNNHNINVFIDPNKDYFCHFISSKYDMNIPYKEIKLYIPIDKEHIYDGANYLFDFLIREKIQHMSKIGRHIRFDDIVVRVTNMVDADKVISFVNNNSYLREGNLPLNPFTVCDNIVSMTWDGNLSYNSVLSNWISEYINFEKENNNLDDVNFINFYDYVLRMCNLLFEKGIGLREYYQKLEMSNLFSGISNREISYKLLNYYDVTKLILSFLGTNIEKDGIYKYIDKVSDSDYQINKMNEIAMLYDKSSSLDREEYLEQKKEVLRKSFTYMYEKYGYDGTRNRFLLFMEDGNYSRITRYKDARELFINNNITKEILIEIAKEWYIKNKNVENMMNLALDDTYGKYDYYQVTCAIEKMFIERDFSLVINRNGYRMELIKLFSKDDILLHIMEILTRNGYKIEYNDINSLCRLYIDNFNTISNKRKKI